MSLKHRILNWIFPVGSVGRILRGPLRGTRFRISPNSGWGPLRGGTEVEVALLMQEFVRPGWVVYDLGANIGIYSLLYSKLVGSHGLVIAFEPLPANLVDLQDNLQLNDCSNVSIRKVAVGSGNSRCRFVIGSNNTEGKLDSKVSASAASIEVQVECLDDLVASGTTPPDLIKVDIEGGEADALDGADRLISSRKPPLFVELHTPEQDRRVGAFLVRHGYHVCRIERGGKPNRFGLRHLSDVQDLSKTWPDSSGIWGRILAVHPEHEFLTKPRASAAWL